AAVAGPVGPLLQIGVNQAVRLPGFFLVMIVLTLAFIVVTFVAVLVLPIREVTQPPYRFQRVMDYLLPGTGTEWSVLGGAVLWSLFFLAVEGLAARTGGLIFSGGFPNLQRTFGIPANAPSMQSLQPRPLYFLLAIVALYVLNAVWISFSRRR